VLVATARDPQPGPVARDVEQPAHLARWTLYDEVAAGPDAPPAGFDQYAQAGGVDERNVRKIEHKTTMVVGIAVGQRFGERGRRRQVELAVSRDAHGPVRELLAVGLERHQPDGQDNLSSI